MGCFLDEHGQGRQWIQRGAHMGGSRGQSLVAVEHHACSHMAREYSVTVSLGGERLLCDTACRDAQNGLFIPDRELNSGRQ